MDDPTSPGSGLRERLDWKRPALPAAPQPPLWRDPPRLMLALAAAGLVVGSLIPWAEGVAVGQAQSFRATQGTAEGVFLIAGGFLLAFLARNRYLWETSSRTVQLLPLLVAAISVPMWIGADGFAHQYVALWAGMGGDSELTGARYLIAGSIGLTVGAFAWLEIARPADVRRQTRPLWVEWDLSRWGVATALAALAGAMAGAAAGVIAGMVLSSGQFVLLAVIFSVFGLFIGIGAGVKLVRGLRPIAGRR